MKTIRMALNQRSINHAIGELKRYKDSLAERNETFVVRLLEYGIHVAERDAGEYGKFIEFYKEGKGGIRTVGTLIAKDHPFTVSWDVKGKKKTAEVSPLLMAEFGSGRLAEVLFDIQGVGQGTFPGQTHADEPYWWYKEWQEDGKGEWKMGFPIRPKHPMYNAEMEMIQRVQEVAREVFGNGF